jgi:hypothetical protein
MTLSASLTVSRRQVILAKASSLLSLVFVTVMMVVARAWTRLAFNAASVINSKTTAAAQAPTGRYNQEAAWPC